MPNPEAVGTQKKGGDGPKSNKHFDRKDEVDNDYPENQPKPG